MISVITYATGTSLYLSYFIMSCAKYKISPTILDWGQSYRGLGARLKVVNTALAQLAAHSSHVLFVDAYDVIFVENLNSIFSKYSEMNHPLILSTEKNCFPDIEKAHLYPSCDSPYRFVNGGGWMGETQYILDVFQKMELEKFPDNANDQTFWTDLFLSEPSSARLDTNCSIFQSLFEADDDLEYRVAEESKYVVNKLTHTRPSILHGNGGVNMTLISEWHGLDTLL